MTSCARRFGTHTERSRITGPTVGGHVLLECSYTDNDQLHANFYVAGRWVAYNPTFDRQICS